MHDKTGEIESFGECNNRSSILSFVFKREISEISYGGRQCIQLCTVQKRQCGTLYAPTNTYSKSEFEIVTRAIDVHSGVGQ